MDAKEIRELIEFVSNSDFESFELEQNGVRIKLVRRSGPLPVAPPSPSLAAPLAAAPAAATPVAASRPEAQPAAPSEAVEDGLYELHSPIIGTFFSAPGPDASNFVEVGARVKKGQALCIVEAMKVMNEIESEIDAEVVEVLVKNGQPVEFGEVLFRLRPS